MSSLKPRQEHADSTRARILIAASDLFAIYGYGGATTRMIAAAADIQQPSLFHFFKSKAEIIEELMRASMEPPLQRLEKVLEDPRPAAERLYEYLCFDIQFVLNSPYNIAGIHLILEVSASASGLDNDPRSTDVAARWRLVHARWRAARRQLIAQGIASGEFVAMDIELADAAIGGLVLQSILRRRFTAFDAERAAEELATFAVRALRP